MEGDWTYFHLKITDKMVEEEQRSRMLIFMAPFVMFSIQQVNNILAIYHLFATEDTVTLNSTLAIFQGLCLIPLALKQRMLICVPVIMSAIINGISTFYGGIVSYTVIDFNSDDYETAHVFAYFSDLLYVSSLVVILVLNRFYFLAFYYFVMTTLKIML